MDDLRDRLKAKAFDNVRLNSTYSLSPDEALAVFKEWLAQHLPSDEQISSDYWECRPHDEDVNAHALKVWEIVRDIHALTKDSDT